MTRLIEALKKAEEAKRKEKTPKKSQDFSLELEEQDTPGSQDELEYRPEIPEPDSGLSLEEEPSGAESDSADDPKTSEDSTFEPAPAYQAETESQLTTEFDPALDDLDTGRRLTDRGTTRLDANAALPATKRNRRLAVYALIALLLFGGVSAFLYWQLGSQDNPYANLAPQTQNRGFLDSSASQEATGPDGIENTDPDTQTQVQAQPETQTTIGPTVSAPPENPNQQAPDETISAVNALLASPVQTSSEPEVTARRTAVFNIQNVQQVPGSEDALAFARANMQEGEWEAAKSELEALLRAQPSSVRALEYLARVHIEMGNFSQAENVYARILQLDPRNSVAQAGLIRVSQTDSLGYEATLQALQDSYPDKAFIPYMLGNHFAGQNRWSEAAGTYRQAVSLAESFGEIPAQYVYNLAISLEHLRRNDEALAQYRRAANLTAQGSNNIDTALLNSRIERLETSLGQ